MKKAFRQRKSFLEAFSDDRKWTVRMLDSNDSILIDIVNKLMDGTEPWSMDPNWFGMDFCVFTTNAEKHESRWELEIAVKQANQCGDWIYEYAKLLNLVSGLKVIIGYEDFSDPGITDLSLKEAIKIQSYKRYTNPEDEILAIIGPDIFSLKWAIEEEVLSTMDFRYFLIKSGSFKELTGSKIFA